jgi:phosphoribosylamine--glycine ligase
MKVLVIGQGGREHALVRALKQSPCVDKVIAIPGSMGMEKDALCLSHSLTPSEKLIAEIRDRKIDLVVIGPEGPLAEGLADRLREAGVSVFGPSAQAAQLEASKVFSKRFMERAGVPTSGYRVVNSVEQVMAAAKSFVPPYVLKADGLAGGKGVFICRSLKELQESAHSIFVDRIFGDAGHEALLEEFLPGWELSFLVLTNGSEYEPLPLSQDHKRLNDGDEGPNTGGMGVVGPLTIPEELYREIDKTILAPSVAQLKKESLFYRGVLYVGIMVTEKGPMVLEYNVRFGDPEAQVILPLLDGDWGQVLKEVAEGRLQTLKWKSAHCACVVLAAEGYPERPKLGVKIEGDLDSDTFSQYFLHAGSTKGSDGYWLTAGGRVLNAVGCGPSMEVALKRAYSQAEKVSWKGRQMRIDIGKKVSVQK